MYGQDFLSRLTVTQNQSLTGLQIFEQDCFLIIVFIKIVMEVFPDIVFVFKTHVVVSIQHDHAVFFMEVLQGVENIAVGDPDMLEMSVFPQLIAVTGLNIGVTVVIIVGHRVLIDGLVAGKFIGQAVIAPMAVGKEDQAGRFIKLQDFG